MEKKKAQQHINKNLNEFSPIQKVWEQQDFGKSDSLLTEAKTYIKTLPSLIGTGPSTSVILDLNQSQLLDVSGDFLGILGIEFIKNMKLNHYIPFIYPEHNTFIAKHFPTYLNYLLQASPEERKQIDLSVIFKYKRAKKYYWIHQRIFKTFSDDNGSLRYPILEYTDITDVKNDDIARFIVYEQNKGHLINESYYPDGELLAKLTPTELVITRLTAEGKSDHEISVINGVSIGTVKQHKKHIFAKLGIHKSTELVALAYNNGLMNST